MPLIVKKIDFKSKIFKPGEREQIISNANTRIAKKFKDRQKRKQTDTQKTGLFYPKYRGGIGGYRRFHRASSQGEYPAPDTMNLVNSMEDQKMSYDKHAVFVNDSKAPYGKYLVRPRLKRKILPRDDVKQFIGTDMEAELNLMIAKLRGV
jgi:hypothetical protein